MNNKENKKKLYDILNSNLSTPTPQQRTTTTKAPTSPNITLTHKEQNNNKKFTYEQQQEQRRRLLEEFRRKKEEEKQNKQNNKMKDKQTAQKKIEEEKRLSKRAIAKEIKVETKNANVYNKSNLDKYQTPVQDPIKRLSPKKSATLSFPMQQHPNTSLMSLEPMTEIKDNNEPLVNQPIERMKSELDNDPKRSSRTCFRINRINSKTPAPGKPQRVKMGSTAIDDNTDETVDNNNNNRPARTSSLSGVEHQRVVSLASNNLCSTPADSPYRYKRSPIQQNPAILSFGKAQRMKNDIIEEKEIPISTLSTPEIYTTPQVLQTPPSTLLFSPMTSGGNIQRSKFISEYVDSEDNATSSFEFTSSPTINLPKLKRSAPRRSPASNPAIASFGKAQRIKVVKGGDSEGKEVLTPKASDYANNTSVTTNELNVNDIDGSIARHFFSTLATTPFKGVNKTSRLLDFSQAKEDDSFIEQDGKCVDELDSFNLEMPEIQKTPKATSPFLKDNSIQTSPYLLAGFKSQEDSIQENSKFDFTKWTKHYVLSIYDPKTYGIKYTEVVPFPTISFFSIKDAVRVAETGLEILAQAMFDILEVDWPSHSKKIGILTEKIPPREKAQYWIERARFEERRMHYEEAFRLYEKAEELNAKPTELVKEEHGKFLARLCSLFKSPSSKHEKLIEYRVEDEVEEDDEEDDEDEEEDDDYLCNLSVLLEYESGIHYIHYSNNELNEEVSQSSSSTIRREVRNIVQTLDDFSLGKKVIKDKNSVQETPESVDPSLTLLTSVKAKKKEREEMRVEKVVTPVRRSARFYNSHSEDDCQTPEDRTMLLERNGYAPNPALSYSRNNKNITPLKKSTKKDDDLIFEKPKPVSGKKTVTWEDLKEK